MQEKILEGPNFYVRTKTSPNRILVALKRQVRYTIYLFDGESPVARKIIRGRTSSIEKVEVIVKSHLGS